MTVSDTDRFQVKISEAVRGSAVCTELTAFSACDTVFHFNGNAVELHYLCVDCEWFVKDKGMLGAFAWEYREDDSSGTLRKVFYNLMTATE